MSAGRLPPNDLTGNFYTHLLSASQRQHRLLTVHWELTHRCNERCSHCYLDVLSPGRTCARRTGRPQNAGACSTS